MKAPQIFSKDGAPVESIEFCSGAWIGWSVSNEATGEHKYPILFHFLFHKPVWISKGSVSTCATCILQQSNPVKRHFVMITDTFLDVPLDTNDQWMKKLGIKSRSDSAATELFSEN